MNRRGIYYHLINSLFHSVHLLVILFVATGWMVSALLPFHLALTGLTLMCWFILGLWFGFGYCPISDWHWKFKGALGDGQPQGSYIHFVLQHMRKNKISAAVVDKVVLVGTVVIMGISLFLNLQGRG